MSKSPYEIAVERLEKEEAEVRQLCKECSGLALKLQEAEEREQFDLEKRVEGLDRIQALEIERDSLQADLDRVLLEVRKHKGWNYDEAGMSRTWPKGGWGAPQHFSDHISNGSLYALAEEIEPPVLAAVSEDVKQHTPAEPHTKEGECRCGRHLDSRNDAFGI